MSTADAERRAQALEAEAGELRATIVRLEHRWEANRRRSARLYGVRLGVERVVRVARRLVTEGRLRDRPR